MPISQTLCFFKFPIIQTKPNLYSPVKYCNFIPDFSKPPDYSNQFAFQVGSKNQDSTVHETILRVFSLSIWPL